MSEKEPGLNPGSNKCQFYDQELDLSPLSLLLVYKDNKETQASLVAQRLKRLPEMRETWVRSLGREDSSGKGNGNPLQYSCLENPIDRGAW